MGSLMKNVLPQKTCLKFCKAVYSKKLHSWTIAYTGYKKHDSVSESCRILI